MHCAHAPIVKTQEVWSRRCLLATTERGRVRWPVLCVCAVLSCRGGRARYVVDVGPAGCREHCLCVVYILLTIDYWGLG